MDIREKMHSGDLYLSMDEDLFNEQLTYLDKLYDFNATRPLELEKRTEMLKNMFAEIGDDCYIEPPLAYQYNLPIHIGKNCWLGAGVIVLPGVTIGDNSVIGAGSVVTKDIPANVVAVGNPCKVLREINEHDKEFYFKDRKINL